MSFWKNKNVLVTAAHGFTGSHLCRELLQDGAQVRGLVKPGSNLSNLSEILEQISLFEGDITHSACLKDALKDIEYIFHPAAIVPVPIAREFPEKTFQTNAIATFNLAFQAMNMGVKKMAQISTCHVYGNVAEKDLPILETTAPRMDTWDLYAASKYAAEVLLRPLMVEGFPIVITRSFAKFGPGQSPQFLIPRIISQMLRTSGQITLGNPKPTRDYSYITDIVRGYMLALEKGRAGEIYHFSSQKEISVKEVVEKIQTLLQKKFEISWNDAARPNDILRQFGNSQKARTELGWQPKISFDEGLKKTIAWWQKQSL